MFTILALFGSASVLILLVGRSPERTTIVHCGPTCAHSSQGTHEATSAPVQAATAAPAPIAKPSFMQMETRAERRSRRLEDLASQLKVDELIADLELEMEPTPVANQSVTNQKAEFEAVTAKATTSMMTMELPTEIDEFVNNVATMPTQKIEPTPARTPAPGLQVFEPGDWRQQASRTA